MKLKTLKDFIVKDMLVLLRIDINSPVINGKIEDNPRFNEASKTIKYLIEKKAKTVILAHQGRKGDSDFIPLEQHAKLLSKYVGKEIKYIDDLFDDKAFEAINYLEMGNAILMANVRNYDDEMEIKGSRFPGFTKFFDLYVNDAFSVSHRKQGSIVIPPEFIPSCAGLNLEKEIKSLEKFSLEDKRKATYLLGGAKIQDYFPIFNVLKNKNAKILASGVLASLFLVCKGIKLGYENKWLIEKKYDNLIPKLKDIYEKHEKQIIIPLDFAIGDLVVQDNKRKEIGIKDFPTNKKIWDLGTKTIVLFKKEIEDSEVFFMKGPPGYSEYEQYSMGTVEILKKVSELTKNNRLFSLLGGGHLTTSIEKYKIENNFSHISTAGGALIAFISGEKLPGIEALEKNVKTFKK